MPISRIDKIKFGRDDSTFDGDGNPRKALQFLKAIDAQLTNKGASMYTVSTFVIQNTELMSERLTSLYSVG